MLVVINAEFLAIGIKRKLILIKSNQASNQTKPLGVGVVVNTLAITYEK